MLSSSIHVGGSILPGVSHRGHRDIRNASYKPILAIIAVACVAALCVAYGYFIEPNRLIINHDEIKIKGWDPAFDGIRIAMIGDIHGGSNNVTEEKLRLIVEKTNAENPDLIVLLGDYVSQVRENKPISERGLKMPIETIANNLSRFTAKYGVLVVLGNHDGWYSDTSVAAEFTRVGFRVLQDEVAVIEKNGKKLRFLGMFDHMKVKVWKDYSEAAKQAVLPTDKSGDLVVLQHSPDILHLVTGELSISDDLKLFLAAHHHGGQIWLPILGRPIIPSSYGQKYANGHIKDRGLDMYVTSGIGTSVLPFRFMVPPEIMILTVRTE